MSQEHALYGTKVPIIQLLSLILFHFQHKDTQSCNSKFTRGMGEGIKEKKKKTVNST